MIALVYSSRDKNVYLLFAVSILEEGEECRVRERALQPVQTLGQVPLLLQRAASEPDQASSNDLNTDVQISQKR